MRFIKRVVLCIGVVAIFCSQGMALTLSDVRTQIRRNVRDTASSSSLQRYSDTVLNAFINEAQRDVVTASWCLELSTGHTLVSGTTFYSLPTDLLAINQVHFRDTSNRIRLLEETSERKLYKDNPEWIRQSGPPMQYFVLYSTSGGDNLQTAYVPVATSASTGTVTIDYYSQANDMSSDSDVPFDGYRHLYPYHYTLVYQVTAKIKMIEGLVNEAVPYTQLYTGMVTTMIQRLGEMPNYSPDFSATSGPK